MQKEILLIHPYALTPEMSGPTRAYDLAKSLGELGNNVTVVSSSFHYEKYIETKEYKNNQYFITEKIGSVNFIWVKTKPYKKNNYKRFLNWIDFYIVVKNKLNGLVSNKIDYIIGSSPHPFGAYAAFKFSKKVNAKFLFEFRDIWPDTLIESFGLKKSHPFVLLCNYLTLKLYKNSDHVISSLPYGYKKVLEECHTKTKDDISWIPNGVDVESYENNLEFDLPSEFEYLNNNSDKKIIYTGSLGKTYDLISFIKAINLLSKKYQNISVTIVGNGAQKVSLLNQVKKMGLSNIHFHEPIEKKYIPKLLSKGNILFATFNEGNFLKYGISMNKLQDYMLSGNPVLMGGESIVGSPVEMSKVGFIVNSHDSEKIAEKILTIFKLEKSDLEHISKTSKEYIKNNFDTKKLGEKLDDILTKV